MNTQTQIEARTQSALKKHIHMESVEFRCFAGNCHMGEHTFIAVPKSMVVLPTDCKSQPTFGRLSDLCRDYIEHLCNSCGMPECDCNSDSRPECTSDCKSWAGERCDCQSKYYR